MTESGKIGQTNGYGSSLRFNRHLSQLPGDMEVISLHASNILLNNKYRQGTLIAEQAQTWMTL